MRRFWRWEKINLSGRSPENRSRSRPKSVHMHSSRADNVHEILGAIGEVEAKSEARMTPVTPIFYCLFFSNTR